MAVNSVGMSVWSSGGQLQADGNVWGTQVFTVETEVSGHQGGGVI